MEMKDCVALFRPIVDAETIQRRPTHGTWNLRRPGRPSRVLSPGYEPVEIGRGLPHSTTKAMELPRQLLNHRHQMTPLVQEPVEPMPGHGIGGLELSDPSELVVGKHSETMAKVYLSWRARTNCMLGRRATDIRIPG
jgi:hypothetical protein